MKPQFRRIPQPKPKWTNHHNKGILLAVAIIFLSVAAVEKQVEWKTQNDNRLQFLINKLRFCPSILTCQNFDQSWSRMSFVGGNRELWHVKEEKSKPNFCIYIINKTKNLLLVIYPKLPAKIMWLPKSEKRKRSLDTPANLVLYRLIFPVSIPAEGEFERVTWLHAIGRSLCRRTVLRTRQVQII